MQRRPEIDLLRVVAMVSVFAAHAAQPFNPWDVWIVESSITSKALGELVLFVTPWVMPLFVLLGGASAWYSLERRSARAYLSERVVRLIIPLAAGILLIVPPQVYLGRRQHGWFAGSIVAFYPRFFDGIYPTGNFTLAHLWFLAVLALLALITLPLFQMLRTPRGRKAMSALGAVCERHGAILLLAVPAVAVRVAFWICFPHARPIVLDWVNRTTLLPMFVSGFMLAAEPRLMQAVDRQWRLSLVIALTFSSGMFAWAWPGAFTERFPHPFSGAYVTLWSIYALGAWAWCVALLGAARAIPRTPLRFLGRTRALLNPFYILHQTVIVVVAYYLIGRAAPAATYAVLVAIAFAATTVLAMLANRSPVTRVLLGMRTTSPIAESHDHVHDALDGRAIRHHVRAASGQRSR